MQAEDQSHVEEGKALALLALSEASTQDNNSGSSSTKTIIVDPRGDLTLRVGLSDTGNEPAQSFQVCSRTLARISPVLERMLYGRFAESNTQNSQTDWAVDLPEEKPATFAILAYISHSRFDEIPHVFSTDELFNLIILTHYYDCTKVLAPWAERWLASIHDPAPSRGELELYRILFICQELGDKHTFENIARRIAVESRELMERDELHEALGAHMTQIIDRIDLVRAKAIDAMLDLFRELTEDLVVVDEKPRRCRYASYMGPHRCESMILGSVVFCLTRAGLWPIPASSREIDETVVGLWRKLRGLIIHDIGRGEGKNGDDHTKCNPGDFLLERLNRLLGETGYPVTDEEIKYVQKQRRRLKTGSGKIDC